MAYDGNGKVVSATVGSAATSSEAVDLGGYYENCLLEIPSAVTADVRLLSANNLNGTYRNVYAQLVGGSPTDFIVVNVKSSTTDCVLRVPTPSRFAKVEVTTAMADGGVFYFTVY